MSIFDEVFETEELKRQPPVLIDLGAAGSLHKEWKEIAKHSICIAFDADEREFSYIEKDQADFKKLFIFNCIGSDKDLDQLDFFLTRSPQCSSTLEPDNEALSDWSFRELFLIERKIKLRSRSILSVLNELRINYIDWFKADTQGTDLKLFKSIGLDLIHGVLIADFEPGIIDAYKGEEKLYEVLSFMNDLPFWLTNLDVKGARRMSDLVNQKYAVRAEEVHLRDSPCWGEMSYMNNFRGKFPYSKRDILLGWIFATIKNQHGFSLELLIRNEKTIGQELYNLLCRYSEELMFKVIPHSEITLRRRVKNKIINLIEKI